MVKKSKWWFKKPNLSAFFHGPLLKVYVTGAWPTPWDDRHSRSINKYQYIVHWGGLSWLSPTCTANEGPVRIQYKWLVLIYVFPEMKLLFPKQNYTGLSPSSYIQISVRGSVCLFCCREICGSILGIYKSLTDTSMWKLGMRRNSQESNMYINGIFLAVCVCKLASAWVMNYFECFCIAISI